MRNMIHIDPAQLKPTTIAALVADLLDSPEQNAILVKSLVFSLEELVGEEDAIDHLIDAGIIPSDNAAGYEIEQAN